MKSVGQILKEKRVQRGFSLEEVATSTRIKKEYLQALEASDYRKFAAPVYIKGFLKNYAESLGINPKEILAFWRREYDEEKSKPKSVKQPPQPINRPFFIITPGILFGAFFLIVVSSFLVYLYVQYSSFALSPLLLVDEPQDQLKTERKVVEIIGRTDKDANLSINGQKISSLKDGNFAVRVDLQPGVNILTIEATNKLGKKSKVQRTVQVLDSEEEKVETAPSPTPVSHEGVSLAVKIGPESTWLQISTDGTVFYEGILVAGTEKTWTGDQILKIKTGNAGSTTISVNGKDYGLMGEKGEVIEREFKR